MTRTFRAFIGICILLFLVFAIASNTQASDDPQVVRVTVTDRQVDLSQFVVTPGKTIKFVVDNQSALAHHLVFQPMSAVGSASGGEEPVIGPGTIRALSHTFAPGIYRIVCATADHSERGLVNVFAAQAGRPAVLPVQLATAIPFLALVLGAAYILADSMGVRVTRSEDT